MGETCKLFRINGLVQGVGFRPTVYRIVTELSLNGEVFNDAEGVGVILEGEEAKVLQFPRILQEQKPPLARIDYIHMFDHEICGYEGFSITKSQTGQVKTAITADAATCQACLKDLFNKANRRYRYAFTNCTHCGPRYTITRHLPYDRPQTSMAKFPMCPECQSEYDDPLDRRFHAQPNACPNCGPQLRFYRHNKKVINGDPVDLTVEAILNGEIVAVKGIGGFHLVCDARNPEAVKRLRQRKHRDDKPLAIMVANLRSARNFVDVNSTEAEILTSSAHPIVLLKKKETIELDGIAPGLADLGVMLPYTPLHWLIFHSLCGKPSGSEWTEKENLPFALVMTSANLSGFPLEIDNDYAYMRLKDIVDAWLDHDRDILIRCDDSVVRVIDNKPVYIRRSRGYAPEAIKVSKKLPMILACGSHLKNTVAISRDQDIFLSQHIGDLENIETHLMLNETVTHLEKIFEISPQYVACDRHPDFYSTRYAFDEAKTRKIQSFQLQHHASHIAVGMAELGRTEETLGIALDGVGLGDDAQIWGSELLFIDAKGQHKRLGHIKELPLPGGDVAAREPQRMGASVLVLLNRTSEIKNRFPTLQQAEHFDLLVKNPRLSPLTSSLGRWFDAVSSLLGLCYIQHDEARAAMLLETLGSKEKGENLYHLMPIDEMGVIDPLPFIDQMLTVLNEKNVSQWAANFHVTLAYAYARLVKQVAEDLNYEGEIILSGGCLVNRLLHHHLFEALTQLGLRAYCPTKVPPGDGGLALGQIWLTALKTGCFLKESINVSSDTCQNS